MTGATKITKVLPKETDCFSGKTKCFIGKNRLFYLIKWQKRLKNGLPYLRLSPFFRGLFLKFWFPGHLFLLQDA